MVQPFDYMHKSGNSGLVLQNYAARLDGASGGANALPHTLLAQPFFTGDLPLTLAQIGIDCTGTGAGNIEIGIYDCLSTRDIYPRNRLFFGSVNYSATGPRLTSASITLPAGKLFWLVTNTDGGSGTNSSVVSSNEITVPVGVVGLVIPGASTGANQVALGLSLTRAYGLGLPATFPAGADKRNNQFGAYPAIILDPADYWLTYTGFATPSAAFAESFELSGGWPGTYPADYWRTYTGFNTPSAAFDESFENSGGWPGT